MIEPTTRDGVVWAKEADPPCQQSQLGWPDLQSTPPDPCDGRNPMSGRLCRLGYHQGYHRDDTGVEWLDD